MERLNLFERLSLENQKKVKEVKVKDENYVMDFLKEKHYYTELTIHECVSLFYYIGIDFSLSELVNLFEY